MGEKAAALDEEAGGGREKDDPTGIGLGGDEDFAWLEGGFAWIGDDADGAFDDAGAGSNSLEIGLRGSGGRIGFEGFVPVEGASGGEAVGWRVARLVELQFRFSSSDEGFEGLGFSGFEDFVEGEEEDVVDRLELVVSVEAAAEFSHDAADTTEDASAFETEVFAVADEFSGLVDQEIFEEALGEDCFVWLWFLNFPGGEGSDGLEERAWIIDDGGGFKLEFFEAAVSEFIEIGIEFLV